MNHFVYLLRCRDNSLYCGYTTNVTNRVKAHNSGKGSKYVAKRRPSFLVYFEECSDKSSALKREYQIKQWSKEMKEKLIATNSNILKKSKN